MNDQSFSSDLLCLLAGRVLQVKAYKPMLKYDGERILIRVINMHIT